MGLDSFSGNENMPTTAKYAGESLMRKETVRDRLQRERQQIRERGQQIDQLLALLERNPDIDEILNLSRSIL